MNQPDKKYQQLAEKWMNGTITPSEEADFAAWYAKDQEKPLEIEAGFATDETAQRNRMYSRIQFRDKPERAKSFKIYRWAIAASITILMCLGIFIFQKNNDSHTPVQYASDIPAGKNQAFLILANGKKIALNAAANGQLAEQAGSTVIKKEDGQLVYHFTDNQSSSVEENTIETPLGGQYSIVLPDQTQVWLNSGSSITFPTSFASAKNRNIKLSGEAYFEVAHDSRKPFIVNAGKQEVKVLGTHFNVKAYADEPAIKTTLAQGSILLNNELLLHPGEQAINNQQGITVEPVDAEYAMAWKEGKFRFHNQPVKELMRDVARWYNVEVVYRGNMQDKEFSGVVSRFDNVSKILNVLESTNTVHFQIEGRRIIVMP